MGQSTPVPDKFVLAKLVRLRDLLGEETGRTALWAHSVCVETRKVHIAVWDFRPAAELVEKTVIRAFKRAADGVEGVRPTDEHPTDGYAQNIRVRIANLGRYVKKLESAIAPGAPLEEPPALGPVEIPALEIVTRMVSDGGSEATA